MCKLASTAESAVLVTFLGMNLKLKAFFRVSRGYASKLKASFSGSSY